MTVDTKEDESVKKQRSVIVGHFPHREAFQQNFKSDSCDARTLCVKSVNYLENFQSRDPDHFWLDLSRSNYLTMLYFNCSPPKLEEAMRQNEETLKRDPRNFNALWCRSELFLHQKKYLEVKDSLRRMEDVLNDSVQMVTAKAELGVSYPDFGPAFYQTSIRLLEDVLQELSSIPELVQSNDLLGSRTIKWTFDLAHTYNRLMNKGTIQTYWDDSIESCPKHEVLFKRIKELFEQVAASDNPQYTAEAWIELGDAFKKYEEKVPVKERKELLPYGKTIDDCFEMALELGPDDVFVLERCGRHYRQRATDISELETAVDFLKRCIEHDSYRDVAYHHMGLAFRSMWLEEENHEEARIHTNRTKKHGEKQSIRKMQQQKSLSFPANHNQSPSFNQKTRNTKGSSVITPTDTERGSGYTSVPYGRSVSEAGVVLSFQNNNPIGASALSKHRLSEPTTSIKFSTIPPKYPKRESEVPKHYRKPDYFDNLRARNPLAKDPLHRYLLEARNYFQTASDIRQGTSCRYLVDLARTYVSTCDLTKAWDLLVQASNSDYSSNDGAYLYEQWGLMAERQVQTGEDVDENVGEFRCIEEVKNFYRKAIRFSAESKERSRVGFYRLRDIIYDQMQDNPSEIFLSILKKEHLLLYKTIQDARKAQEILDNMKSEESIVLMWELVDLFYSRNRPEDADAAFTYLALLADARKLREPVDLDKDLKDVLLERIEWVIQISERRVRRNGGRAQDVLSKAFEWLVTLSDGDIPSEKRSKDTYVVCILAPSSETPGVEKVMSVLTDVVGVEILQGFVEDSPDLPLGKSILEEIENMVRRVRNAVVVMQMTGESMSADERQMLHILKPLVNHPDFATKRFCRAVSSESTAIEYDTLDVHPEWNLDEVDGQSGSELNDSIHSAFTFLRALFSSKKL